MKNKRNDQEDKCIEGKNLNKYEFTLAEIFIVEKLK